MVIGLVIGLIFLVLIIGVVIWYISSYNSFVKLRTDAEEAYSTMDIYMKKRYDLIPNLVETVKGYAKHEKGTLEGVMKARYSCMSANTDEEKAKSENMLTGTLKTLFNITENYPELKADKNFTELQHTLKELEVEITSSRKYYNGCVKVYNVKVESFPSNLVANIAGFKKKTLFEIVAPEEREAPKVQF